jgi:hypothetical protein
MEEQRPSGGRDAGWAQEFMEDCASRISSRVQITTDGHRAYLEAVEGAFGMDVDYAQLQKIYGAPAENHTRCSPATCIGCDMKVVSGNPDPKHVSTSYVERQNLSMRMSIRRFTRLTNAFSKKVENHVAAVAIWFMDYNFARVHQTLRCTPAMEAGIPNHIWTIEELCALIPETSSARQMEKNMVRKALGEYYAEVVRTRWGPLMFESIEFLNRGWDVRILESQSLRSVFLRLLSLIFVLGVDTAITAYQVLHLRHLSWAIVMNLPVLTLFAFRYARIVYLRLGN